MNLLSARLENAAIQYENILIHIILLESEREIAKVLDVSTYLSAAREIALIVITYARQH